MQHTNLKKPGNLSFLTYTATPTLGEHQLVCVCRADPGAATPRACVCVSVLQGLTGDGVVYAA